MNQILAFLFLVPIMLWSTLQPALINNATQIEATLNLALFEGQKQASLQGYYDEEIYKKIRDYLVESHHYDPSKIEIISTETFTPRGEYMYIEIQIPKPMMYVMDIFKVADDDEPYKIRKYIMSEGQG